MSEYLIYFFSKMGAARMFARFWITVIVAALTSTIEQSAGAEGAAILSSANVIAKEGVSILPVAGRGTPNKRTQFLRRWVVYPIAWLITARGTGRVSDGKGA
jgi:hypothetical protein